MKSVDEDCGEITWRVVQKFVSRNIYEAGTSAYYESSEDDTPIVEAYQEDGKGINLFVDFGALELLPLFRDDVPPIHLNPSILNDYWIQVSEKEEEEKLEEEDESESEEKVHKKDQEEVDDDDEYVIEGDFETSMVTRSQMCFQV